MGHVKWRHRQPCQAHVQGKPKNFVFRQPGLIILSWFSFSRSTHNIFAVAIVNSNFKKAESDYTQLDDTLLSSGLDILNEVILEF